MTLIVGIYCRDGVVLGADGVATIGFGPNIKQAVRKLKFVDPTTVFGVAGPVGISQIFYRELVDLTKQIRRWDSVQQAADSISDRFAPHAERVYHRTERMNDALDRQAFSTGFESLLALVVNGEHHLLHFDAATTVEEFDANLPIALIGSVRSHAAPFLPFLCEAMGLRASGLTDLRSAEIAVLWTLDQVIGSVAHGVGWPVQVVTLFRAGHGSYRAWELTPETLASHRAAIRRMAGALSAAAREEIQGADPRTRRALPARNGAAAWFGPDGVYPPLGLGGVPLQAIPEAPTRPNEPVHGRPTAIL